MSTWVCIGSGPSLTQADCDLVAGLPTIVVNDTWKMAANIPNAILFAGDIAWWDKYHDTVPKDRMECWTRSPSAAQKYKLKFFEGLKGKYNSGQKAIELATHLGAKQIILLGYDCSIKGGLHWHGKHTGGLKNPGPTSVQSWHGEFKEMAFKLKLPPILNCSRHTELTCFPTETLKNALSSLQVGQAQPSCAPCA